MKPLSRHGWLFGSLLLLGAVLAWLSVWLTGTEGGTQRQRLPDGSTVSLLGTTHGRRQEFITGVRWQKLLYPLVPPVWKERLGSISRMYCMPPEAPVTIWARHVAVSPGFDGSHLRVSTVDQHGCELWTEEGGAYGLEGSGSNDLLPLALDLFPRRGSAFGVRVYRENSQYIASRLAEFVVPNPDPGPHPVWSAPPLPQSVSRDGFTFTLDRFVTGLAGAGVSKPAGPNEVPWSQIRFHVSRDGHTRSDWYAADVASSDATGNHMHPHMHSYLLDGTEKWYAWQGGLCTHETYRLRTEFTCKEPVDESDFWTLKNVQLPAPGVVKAVNWSATRHGTRLLIKQITGRDAKPDGWESLEKYWPGACFIVFAGLGNAPSDRVRLVRAVDTRGRNLAPERARGQPASYSTKGDAVFAIERPTAAETVNLTFAVRRSYYVDFVARPMLPGAP